MKPSNYYAIRFDKDYLEHYGVDGQKWGVQHGPPYPLDDNPSVQAKRKAESNDTYETTKGSSKPSIVNYIQRKRQEKQDRIEKEAAEAKKKEAENKKKADADWKATKANAIKDGDLKTLYSNYSKFTDKEIGECISRYQMKTSIATLSKVNDSDPDVQAAKKFVDEAIARGDLKAVTSNPEKFSNEQIEAARQKNEMVAKADNQVNVNRANKTQQISNVLNNAANIANNSVKLYNTVASVHNAMNPGQKQWTKIDISIPSNKENKDGGKDIGKSLSNLFKNDSNNSSNSSNSSSNDSGKQLSYETIKEIKAKIGTMKYDDIASQYGVDRDQIDKIKKMNVS